MLVVGSLLAVGACSDRTAARSGQATVQSARAGGDSSPGVKFAGDSGPGGKFAGMFSPTGSASASEGSGGFAAETPASQPTAPAQGQYVRQIGEFEATKGEDRYVVVLSVDGLASRFIDRLLAQGQLPTFRALRTRAAWTHSARTTMGSRHSIPNLFSMLTSRPAADNHQPGAGHGLISDDVLPPGKTVHSYSQDAYVPSVFDVVHDHGGRTGLFTGNPNSRPFVDGYGPLLGSPDPYDGDYGKNKLDVVSAVDGASAAEVISAFVGAATTSPLNFSFLQLSDVDGAQRAYGSDSLETAQALQRVDQALDGLFNFLDSAPLYKDKVHVLLTTDHGATGDTKAPAMLPSDAIPLYVVSPTISTPGDLYALAGDLRSSPAAETSTIPNGAPPIRNSDVGNLSTALLGLPEIPTSTVHSFHLQGRWRESGPPPVAPMSGKFEATGGLGRYVLVISLDGLAPRFIDELLARDQLPTFAALRKRAAWTHNARTTPGSSLTFPNHFSILTSRPALDDEQLSPGRGHQLRFNALLPDDKTIHSFSPDLYLPSIFDVVHDHGGRTGLFASKKKFLGFAEGYGPLLGSPDPYGKDYGKNKVDAVAVLDGERAPEMVTAFIDEAKAAPLNFSLLHLRETDTEGHAHDWGSPEYLEALKLLDAAVGRLLEFLDSTAPYKNNAHVLISTDHGGSGDHHQAVDPLHYTIPLYIIGPTIKEPGDLYALAGDTRSSPPADEYALPDVAPPIRNADLGNLSASLLGLPEIPNSTMHSFYAQGRWQGHGKGPLTPVGGAGSR